MTTPTFPGIQLTDLGKRGQEATVAAVQATTQALRAYAQAVTPSGPQPVDPKQVTTAGFDLAEQLLRAQRDDVTTAVTLLTEAGEAVTAQASAAGETSRAAPSRRPSAWSTPPPRPPPRRRRRPQRRRGLTTAPHDGLPYSSDGVSPSGSRLAMERDPGYIAYYPKRDSRRRREAAVMNPRQRLQQVLAGQPFPAERWQLIPSGRISTAPTRSPRASCTPLPAVRFRSLADVLHAVERAS